MILNNMQKKIAMISFCCRAKRGFKILSGLPPKRGLKYYVALQYRVVRYRTMVCVEEVEDLYRV